MISLFFMFFAPGYTDPDGELEEVNISNDFLLILLLFISIVFLFKYLNNKKISA